MRLFLQLSFPEIIFSPPVRQRVDRAGLGDLHGGSQHIHEDLPLQRLIPHIPEGVAERMLHEQRPRGLDLLSDLPDQGQGDGRKPSLIQHALNQSDGLLAHRSGGDEKDEIDRVFLELRGDGGSGFLQQGLRDRYVAHEGEMPRRQRADHALLR